MKIMSSKSKAQIIALFLKCHCNSHTVNDLCEAFCLQQANTSKHLSNLYEEKILDFVKDGKEVHYRINETFMKEWGDVVRAIIAKEPSLCACSRICPTCQSK